VGEAQQRLLESGGGAALAGARSDEASAAQLAELQESLRTAEEKLLESQSMRDAFSQETDMYRSELKAAREELGRLEEELARERERARAPQPTKAAGAAAGAPQSVVEAVQKEFEGRMERYRDEVQYLRQKCDEKERKCEQLLAERGSLVVELRNAGGGTGLRPVAPALAASPEDLEMGGKAAAGAGAGPQQRRAGPAALPLAAPAWLRSSDEPLRLVVRTLSAHPEARLVFFGYFLLLQLWVLFVMQQWAIQ